MEDVLRVALCQTSSGADVDANEAQVFGLLEEAAVGGADLACLPEVWPCQGSAEQVRAAAEPVPGPRTQRLGALAEEHGVWIHGGSVLELDDDRVYNTSILLDRRGELVARYRKIHLFDADPPGGHPSRESSLYTAGDQIVTAETEFGRAGLSICYDVRFPELYRALAATGTTLLFVPASFRYETGKDHWDVLLRARAIEEQCFVFAAAQWGTWGPAGHERRSYGNSLVVDPWGNVLARAAEGVGVTFAECDLTQVRRVREALPALRHRRLGIVC
ncbi:MAG TPA: carbon-nitrogen hydrolase family protein [Actinomycetota bacterium]|nr:carbon-nitrogen hydrolase family protein [Actinomycetota bacterium]